MVYTSIFLDRLNGKLHNSASLDSIDNKINSMLHNSAPLDSVESELHNCASLDSADSKLHKYVSSDGGESELHSSTSRVFEGHVIYFQGIMWGAEIFGMEPVRAIQSSRCVC